MVQSWSLVSKLLEVEGLMTPVPTRLVALGGLRSLCNQASAELSPESCVQSFGQHYTRPVVARIPFFSVELSHELDLLVDLL